MKHFKKKHKKIPNPRTVLRMINRYGREHGDRYMRQFSQSLNIFPDEIRAVTLAQFDPGKRQNIRYYPDLHNFMIFDQPNRSLPIPKFLGLFRPFMDNAILDQIEVSLTNFRLEFYTDANDWEDVYADGHVDSCMTGDTRVRCYAHPQNKLALAALYAPGTTTVIARTIVNTDEKWYIRLFGDPLLVEKLNELGYKRLARRPKEFRMYGYAGSTYVPGEVAYPYFDFGTTSIEVLHHTHNPDTGQVEVIINPGITS